MCGRRVFGGGGVRRGVPVVVANSYLLANPHGAALNAPDADAPNVIIIVNRRNQHLHRAFAVHMRRRDMLHNLLEQGR